MSAARTRRSSEVSPDGRSVDILPPVVDRNGYISYKAFYAFFEQEGVKTGSRYAGQRLFSVLVSASRTNHLPGGGRLLYCPVCGRGVNSPCKMRSSYGPLIEVYHSGDYLVNAAVFRARWQDLGKLREIRPGDRYLLAIFAQQLKERGK